MSKRPTTETEAYEHGYKSHCEGQNPFRNTGTEDSELYNAWVNGYETRLWEVNDPE